MYYSYTHVMTSVSLLVSEELRLNPAASVAPAASFRVSAISRLLGSPSLRACHSPITRTPSASNSCHLPGHARRSVPVHKTRRQSHCPYEDYQK